MYINKSNKNVCTSLRLHLILSLHGRMMLAKCSAYFPLASFCDSLCILNPSFSLWSPYWGSNTWPFCSSSYELLPFELCLIVELVSIFALFLSGFCSSRILTYSKTWLFSHLSPVKHATSRWCELSTYSCFLMSSKQFSPLLSDRKKLSLLVNLIFHNTFKVTKSEW